MLLATHSVPTVERCARYSDQTAARKMASAQGGSGSFGELFFEVSYSDAMQKFSECKRVPGT